MNTKSVLFKEKRKWQIALRRYILENKSSYAYAEYFGLDTIHLRSWIELQFDEEMNWDNFSEQWQFDHLIPATYFDLSQEKDLRMYWNFTNLQISKINKEDNEKSNTVLLAKKYFQHLYTLTAYPICQQILDKIESIENSTLPYFTKLEKYAAENKTYWQHLSVFTAYEYDRLNTGTEIAEILAEQELLKKFG